MSDRFELVCEVEPPTRPDLTKVRHQIGALSQVAGSFLIPDNHIGRATVSSVAVAHEVTPDDISHRRVVVDNDDPARRIGVAYQRIPVPRNESVITPPR